MTEDASQSQVARVLAGVASFDLLDPDQQAIVRDVWDARVAARRANLNYEVEFEQAGDSCSYADEWGKVIVHSPVT